MTDYFNIANWITEHAKERPEQPAILFPKKPKKGMVRAYEQLNFRQVEELINSYSRGFQQIGIQPGDRVSLFVRPCLEFMPLAFALYKVGAVVVLIDPGMGTKGLLACIEKIAPRVLVGVPRAMLASVLFARKFRSVKIKVTVGGWTWFWGGYRLQKIRHTDVSDLPAAPTTRQDEASVLFTSGSTGPAKGVRYTHGIFDAQTQAIQQMYNIQPGEIDLPCFPLFGLFSLAMGMTVVIPDMDPTKVALADPEVLVEAIQQHQISNAFASPALWRPFVRWCLQNQVKLPSLRRVLSAGAPIPPQIHQAFQQVVREGVEVHTPYGATESLPVASIGSLEVLRETQELTNQGYGTCVGSIAPNMTVRIIQIRDDMIADWSEELCVAEGEIGEVCVRGPVVTTEYKEDPEKTREAKIYNADGSLWHRMGDLGYFDKQGRLWFCGRKSHRVTLQDGTLLFPVPCEGIFNQHPAIARSALVGVAGEAVIVIEKEAEISKQEVLAVGQQYALTAGIQHVLFHPSFPVDVRHNAKIHRLQLAAWAAQQLAPMLPVR